MVGVDLGNNHPHTSGTDEYAFTARALYIMYSAINSYGNVA